MFTEHILRDALTAELHARPHGSMQAPADQVQKLNPAYLDSALTPVMKGPTL